MAILICPRCGAKNRIDERRNTLQPVCGRCGTKLGVAPEASTARVAIVTDATLMPTVLQAGPLPVIVDCWAPWCGPCRQIAPIMEELAAESNGRYRVVKVNVDENPRISRQFRIDNIPTLLIFKEGQVADRIVGALPKDALKRKLAKYLG